MSLTERMHSYSVVLAQVFEALFARKLAWYNQNATLIQKIWRGFYSRKHVHNFYTRKAYLLALTIKNAEVRCAQYLR